MKSLPFKRALVLAAHTDDEFGCSGTMVRLLESGAEVFYAAFSTCAESVPEGYPKDVLAKEVLLATRLLGLQPPNVSVYDFRVRHFPAHRQEILEELVQIRKRLEPDLVMLPALSDLHQDHHVIAEEGLRAFKFSCLLGYELPMNTVAFQHACFVSLEEPHVKRKVDSLAAYRSQSFRPYSTEAFIRGLAKVRGVQAGVEFAEAFEVLRLVI